MQDKTFASFPKRLCLYIHIHVRTTKKLDKSSPCMQTVGFFGKQRVKNLQRASEQAFFFGPLATLRTYLLTYERRKEGCFFSR